MNAAAFILHVERAMPSEAALKAHGLAEGEIDEIRATFLAPRRAASSAKYLSAVEQMVVDFDCSRLEVGLVRFSGQLVRLPRGTCFGHVEADPLVVTKDGSIALCDHARPEVVHQLCAKSADRFLDGMATFVSLRCEKAAWMGRVAEAAERCAQDAGGLQYADFFRSLCALFSL